MRTILVTGSSGFIGRAICRNLILKNHVIGFDRNSHSIAGVTCVKGCILAQDDIQSVLQKYRPDVVVHCAGLSHQKFNIRLCTDDFDQFNNLATKKLSLEAAKVNPQVHFIFLSSISVYGEKQGGKEVNENDKCCPTSDYAVSKLKAEKSLTLIFDQSLVNKVDMLRLPPVYDKFWSFNLEKRVLLPKKIIYMRCGSGCQKMSVLARENLVGFIAHRIESDLGNRFCNTLNICDQFPCTFNEIIETFKQSRYHPDRWVVTIPLWLIWVATRIAGKILKHKSGWIHSFYDKLAKDSIFDNTLMLESGYKPAKTLRSVYTK
jgi:nucleoside-diphosphate-sugar epimerase